MRKEQAFTLIELLIVMAILTLLAGILFTVFAGAKEKARQTQCMNNLKQLGAAILLYKQDYDGGWPTWSYSLYPGYVRDGAVFVCLTDTTDRKTREAAVARHGVYCSYMHCMGDYLWILSGASLRAAMAGSNCSSKRVALATQSFLPRLPMLACRWHLLPGADPRDAEFDEEMQAARIQAPILKLNQDGSVVRWMVPADTAGYVGATSRSGIAGYSFEEWRKALSLAKETLRARGLCVDEE